MSAAKNTTKSATKIAARKVSAVLSKAEVKSLLERSDLQGWVSVGYSWGIIALAFAFAAWQPNVLGIFVALVLLGGQQLGISILMHDCSHRALFKSRKLNDIVGKWLCAAPVWLHLDKYRVHHLSHHNHTGTERDTDLGLVTPFPTSRRSLIRKMVRDLTGVAGARRVVGLLMIDFGFLTYTASTGAQRIDQTGRTFGHVVLTGFKNLYAVIITNAALFGILLAVGQAWLYWVWLAAYMTTYSLYVRLRSLAEHACTDRVPDMFRNTRTTKANVLARLTVAPHHVNYHLEHHLLMTVPHYHLRRMHRLLLERGALDGSPIASGYWEVLKTVGLEPTTRTA